MATDVPDNLWDLLEGLEPYVSESEFPKSWRAFVRACLSSLSELPEAAHPWIAAADEYNRGKITSDQLTAVRVKAWQLLDAGRGRTSPGELRVLRLAMVGLWPELDLMHWYEIATFFVDDCLEAGLVEPRLLSFLTTAFLPVLAKIKT